MTTSKNARELGNELDLKLDAQGLFTVVTVDVDTHQVLMVAFMNREALSKTMETGKATYWSRSRNKFWVKGEESGHVQQVQEILVDCDQDALVLKVRQQGVACHNGYRSCFYRRVLPTANGGSKALEFIAKPEIDPKAVYRH